MLNVFFLFSTYFFFFWDMSRRADQGTPGTLLSPLLLHSARKCAVPPGFMKPRRIWTQTLAEPAPQPPLLCLRQSCSVLIFSCGWTWTVGSLFLWWRCCSQRYTRYPSIACVVKYPKAQNDVRLDEKLCEGPKCVPLGLWIKDLVVWLPLLSTCFVALLFRLPWVHNVFLVTKV